MNIEIILVAILLLIGLAAMALFGGAPAPAAAPPSTADAAGGVAGAGDAATTLQARAESDLVEILFTWNPGDEMQIGDCFNPLVLKERLASGPAFVRIDCDDDGAADVWTVIGQGGVTQDQILALTEVR